MNANGPLVSVIVPSFNQGDYLPATLDSILSQSYAPIEVVVVDGASTDQSVAVLEEYATAHSQLRWISEPDNGPADAVNKGLALATGDIAGIQSSDDLYLPGAIAAAVDAFSDDRELGLVYGDATLVAADGTPLYSTKHLPYTLARYLCGSTFINQGSAFFKLSLARELGGWRPQYFAMDVDLWLRMAFRTKVVKLPAVLSAFRQHEGQRDKQALAINESYQRIILDSADIRSAPLRIRLAASAGRRLVSQHYAPGDRRRVRRDMWTALAMYPPAVRAVAKPELLLPTALQSTRFAEFLRHLRR